MADEQVATVRRFNRFYTRHIGVLDGHALASSISMSLSEGRVLFELTRSAELSAAELGDALDIDAGYLSRILRGFESKGWITRRASPSDGRRRTIRLTAAGRRAYAKVDAIANEHTAAQLSSLSSQQRDRLVTAMRDIEAIWGGGDGGDGAAADRASCSLRTHGPGDLGWILQRHGEFYAANHGFEGGFEALVAEIVSRFARTFDERYERLWIAEVDGERAGSIALMRSDVGPQTGQLRLLLVEPFARGRGVGAALVRECLRFAGAVGYERVRLETESSLAAAARLYERFGFARVETRDNRLFAVRGRGASTVEIWEHVGTARDV